jgi:hypothetical protein
MIINGFLNKNLLKVRRFIIIGSLILFFFSTFISYGQTAEAEKNFQVCKACHTIGGGKLVGPDLKGVGERHDEEWLILFIQNSQAMVQAKEPAAVKVFEENNKIPMPNNDLTPEQIKDLLLYIANDGKVAEGETPGTDVIVDESNHEDIAAVEEQKEELLVEMKRDNSRNMRTTFMVMAILILISLFDLIVTKMVKARWIHVIIIAISLIVIGEIIFVEAAGLGRQQYYQPDQPIWFSHKVHAGQNKINCMYCHYTADKSQFAGIPPMQVCMNCHSVVKQGKITGAVEIEKIYKAFETGKPIEWVKVHNLPDHVYFNHAQHVNAGKVDCQECHGAVEKMNQIIQVNDLSMGWCIECHRTKDVQFATNKFYQQYTELQRKLKDGEISKVKVVDVGGEECQQCHY